MGTGNCMVQKDSSEATAPSIGQVGDACMTALANSGCRRMPTRLVREEQGPGRWPSGIGLSPDPCVCFVCVLSINRQFPVSGSETGRGLCSGAAMAKRGHGVEDLREFHRAIYLHRRGLDLYAGAAKTWKSPTRREVAWVTTRSVQGARALEFPGMCHGASRRVRWLLRRDVTVGDEL